ncbi:cytochrome P460 family protein [Methylomonas albis]|uniref:Cytochrome P460 family protein n=1 Tax=Methylomonas albis TaxID=1854563 RepID=A0ABR9D1A5_9GAMM|nr:cytochrome P460 family protein [Methylomonas albis]MBD9356591.1 cytochrome P460 family protein [Methylomonas albis]
MTKTIFSGLCLAAAVLMPFNMACADTKPTAKPEHGEYRDWRLLGVSLRSDKNSIRAIVGNHVAINAARAGKVKPWPDGSIIAKIKWAERKHPNWEQATVPGEFTAAEAMVKDSKKYAETGGWGFGIWEGETLKMLDQEKSAPCFACHLPMKDSDYVYTLPNLQ